jgi:uncharacterized membrane protein YhaH (DUF805 family)
MNEHLPLLITLAGVGHFCILIASSLVPFRLDWKNELRSLSRLHRQMYWIYGGYVVLSIIAFGLISVLNAHELAAGSPLARAFCGYVAIFWGIRVLLQGVLDVREHLTVWWVKMGYHTLTILFVFLTFVFTLAALQR